MESDAVISHIQFLSTLISFEAKRTKAILQPFLSNEYVLDVHCRKLVNYTLAKLLLNCSQAEAFSLLKECLQLHNYFQNLDHLQDLVALERDRLLFLQHQGVGGDEFRHEYLRSLCFVGGAILAQVAEEVAKEEAEGRFRAQFGVGLLEFEQQMQEAAKEDPQLEEEETKGEEEKTVDEENFDDIREDQLEKVAEFVCKDGAVYTGSMYKQTIRHGQGKCVWPDGQSYNGMWSKDQFEGSGRLNQPDGSYYEGNWKEGMAHGIGRHVYADGSKYEGEWRYNKQEGQGIEVLPDGTHYQGGWAEGMKQGKGRMQFPNGEVYDGEFKLNAFEGQGTYYFANKKVYLGKWREGAKEGRGEMQYSSGKMYVGSFFNDKKHGKGQKIYPGGSKCEGDWFEGKKHGVFVFSDAAGKQKKQRWSGGHFIEELTD